MTFTKAKNPPDRIWLQVGEIEFPCEFSECADGVSWCAEKIFENDIEYRVVKRQRKKVQPEKETSVRCTCRDFDGADQFCTAHKYTPPANRLVGRVVQTMNEPVSSNDQLRERTRRILFDEVFVDSRAQDYMDAARRLWTEQYRLNARIKDLEGSATHEPEVDEPSVIGGMTGQPIPPFPSGVNLIEWHVRQIQQVCDALNLDPTQWLNDETSDGATSPATARICGECGVEMHPDRQMSICEECLQEIVDDAIGDGERSRRAASTKCAVPPKGWTCTRTPGHEGPCAAVPDEQ